jgi:Tfp pilus assembly pilus retraction ATPase PilT
MRRCDTAECPSRAATLSVAAAELKRPIQTALPVHHGMRRDQQRKVKSNSLSSEERLARLLDTKLQPPPLRDERVYRPHLYDHLADFDSGVVLVSSPPGFGKSTLVVEWLQSQNRPFA